MRRFWAGLAALAAAVVLVPVSGSQGASETQVDSIRLGPLDDGHQETGTVLLKAGVRYHLVVTGYVTQAGRDPSLGSYADDAFYHFDDSQHPGAPSPPGILFLGLRFGDAPGRVDFIRTYAEDRRDRPPYDPGHRYENHFTLTDNARLVVSASGMGDSNFTYGGPGFVVSVLSGGGSPPPPPRPGPKPGACTRATGASAHASSALGPFFCRAEDWVQAFGFDALGPGGTAIGVSPPLGKLEKAKVTVGGVSDSDLAVVARFVSRVRRNPGVYRARCLGIATHDFRKLLFQLGNYELTNDEFGAAVLDTYADAAACLGAADRIDAYIASHPQAAQAQAPTCALTSFGATVQRRRGRPLQVRVSDGRAPNSPLNVTCVRSQSQIELTVKSRTRGAPLSRFLGPRLAIGIVRSRRDQPGGQVTVRFDRP